MTNKIEQRTDSGEREARIGVVGYSAQKFDEAEATRLLRRAFNGIDYGFDRRFYFGPVAVVSGLTDLGIPALAYREAVSRGWRTIGIACSKAVEYPCFPVDKRIIVGDNWGDESPTFLNSIDFLVRVGGGKQAMREAAEFRKMKGNREFAVAEYDLPALVEQGGK